METCESKDGDDEHANDHDSHDGHDARWGGEVVPVIEHMDEAKDKYCCHVERQGDEKHEKIAIVAPADAVVHPRAVVVEYLEDVQAKIRNRHLLRALESLYPHLYAAVAYGAVGAPGRPVELTGDAPLHSHCNPVYLDVPVERRAKVIVAVLISGRPWYHPGIHKGGQAEGLNNYGWLHVIKYFLFEDCNLRKVDLRECKTLGQISPAEMNIFPEVHEDEEGDYAF